MSVTNVWPRTFKKKPMFGLERLAFLSIFLCIRHASLILMTYRDQIMQMSDKYSRLLKIYSWANARVHTHVIMEAHFATKKIIGKMIRDTFRYGFSPSHISDSEQKIKNTTHNIRLNFKQNISQVTFSFRIFHTIHFYYKGSPYFTRGYWHLSYLYLSGTISLSH